MERLLQKGAGISSGEVVRPGRIFLLFNLMWQRGKRVMI